MAGVVFDPAKPDPDQDQDQEKRKRREEKEEEERRKITRRRSYKKTHDSLLLFPSLYLILVLQSSIVIPAWLIADRVAELDCQLRHRLSNTARRWNQNCLVIIGAKFDPHSGTNNITGIIRVCVKFDPQLCQY